MRQVSRQSERGYALIFVFALTAMMALSLYLELPRLALEMQRNREELLIERGEQYVRAIKVYAKKNKRYPQTIEELENTNGTRFLRHRYKDPMTGKDEWRLIHADGSGRLTDSLVQKQKSPTDTEGDKKSTNTFVSEGPAIGSTADGTTGRAAAALNRRASEQPGAAGAPPPPGEQTPGQGGDPQQTAQYPQQAPQYPQQSIVPIMGPNGQPIQRIPGLPGQFGAGGVYPGAAANSQAGGAVPQTPTYGGSSFGSGYGSGGSSQQAVNGPQPMPGGFRPGGGSNSFGGGAVPGSPIPGGMPGGMPGGINVNPATQMIQQILTRPNPQGLANVQGLQQGGQALGGGIAGVASKVDAEGIKIYNEKTNYKEWEFVYDPSKDAKKAQAAMNGQMQQQNGIPGLNQPSGMGSSSGQSGFGSQQGGFGGQQGGFGGQQGGFGNSPMSPRR